MMSVSTNTKRAVGGVRCICCRCGCGYVRERRTAGVFVIIFVILIFVTLFATMMTIEMMLMQDSAMNGGSFGIGGRNCG